MIKFFPPLKIEKTTCNTVMEFNETKIIKDKKGVVSHVLHYYKTIKSPIDIFITSPYTEKEITDYIRKDIFKIIK